MNDLQKRLLITFDSEQRSALRVIRENLTVLQSRTENSEVIQGLELDESFRMAHSLKGAARVVDIMNVSDISHQLESLFEYARAGKINFNNNCVEIVQHALNTIEDTVSCFLADEKLPDCTLVLNELTEFLHSSPKLHPQMVQPVLDLKVEQSSDTSIASKNSVKNETLRLKGKVLDDLIEMLDQTNNYSRRQEVLAKKIKNLSSKLNLFERKINNLKNESIHKDELNQLMESFIHDTSGELRKFSNDFYRHQREMNRVSARLLQSSVSARMISVETIYEGLSKVVRDMAHKLEKTIDFRIIGEELEADRTLLQALNSPLLHLINNSLDHGFEHLEERLKQGKNEKGTLTLSFRAGAGKLVVELSDDGRGLNCQTIKQSLIRKGVGSEKELNLKSERDIYDMIFLPGFSTSQLISDISGRGMGLSVVKEMVKRFQGEISIQSNAGKGIQFKMVFPMSRSSQHFSVVSCGFYHFAFPCHMIEKFLQTSLSSLKDINGQLFYFEEDRQIPIYSLGQVLKLTDQVMKNNSGKISLVIFNNQHKNTNMTIGFVVDHLVEELEATLLDPGPILSTTGYILGVFPLEDEKLCPVLDPYSLTDLAGNKNFDFEFTEEKKQIEMIQKHILVVDDSITTRTLEKSILESHGFKVTLAIDGVEALELLKVQSFDLVITDVEMPRMDGFTLLEKVKANPNFNDIPVIIVSSKEEKEQLERGLNFGAAAYIVKQRFDQQTLLDAIGQIL